MPGSDQLSNQEARWLAVTAQGLGAPRPAARSGNGRRPGASHLRRVMGQVGTIQLDAVNVVQRTQFLVPFSRIGGYDPAVLRRLTGPGRPWFEYWGHAASLLPVELYPLFRWRMERWRNDLVDSVQAQQRRRAWREEHAAYIAAVRDEVADRGPLAASELSDPRRRDGEWWGRRSDGRRALEMLFGDGELAAWRNANFERVYDLTERVIPPAVLSQPGPGPEDAQRELIARAASSMGVATLADLADYFWIRPGPARQRVSELVEAGRLVPVTVEGWDQPAYVEPGARPRRPRREHASLLSPFDSLIWTRDRTKRLFGFHYRIEIYVPEALRRHGYYVLPLLLGDQLVGRFDLKADRKGGALRVARLSLEPGADGATVLAAAATELHALRAWLKLDRLSVEGSGEAARALRSLARAGAVSTGTSELAGVTRPQAGCCVARQTTVSDVSRVDTRLQAG